MTQPDASSVDLENPAASERSAHEGPIAAERPSVASHMHHAIERVLHSRRAKPGTRLARIESVAKRAGVKAWGFAKRHPLVGVAVAGGAVTAAASVVGAAELAVGIGAGYAAYQVLDKGVPLERAVENARRIV